MDEDYLEQVLDWVIKIGTLACIVITIEIIKAIWITLTA
jgi:phage gp46-like protein